MRKKATHINRERIHAYIRACDRSWKRSEVVKNVQKVFDVSTRTAQLLVEEVHGKSWHRKEDTAPPAPANPSGNQPVDWVQNADGTTRPLRGGDFKEAPKPGFNRPKSGPGRTKAGPGNSDPVLTLEDLHKLVQGLEARLQVLEEGYRHSGPLPLLVGDRAAQDFWMAACLAVAGEKYPKDANGRYDKKGFGREMKSLQKLAYGAVRIRLKKGEKSKLTGTSAEECYRMADYMFRVTGSKHFKTAMIEMSKAS